MYWATVSTAAAMYLARYVEWSFTFLPYRSYPFHLYSEDTRPKLFLCECIFHINKVKMWNYNLFNNYLCTFWEKSLSVSASQLSYLQSQEGLAKLKGPSSPFLLLLLPWGPWAIAWGSDALPEVGKHVLISTKFSRTLFLSGHSHSSALIALASGGWVVSGVFLYTSMR